MNDFKEKLNAALKERGITQRELVHAIGMTPGGFISSLNNNSIKMATFEKICEYLELPYSYFYEHDELPPSAKDESNISVMQNVIDDLLKEIKNLKIKVYTRENQLRQNNVNFHSVSKCGGVLAA